MVHVGPKIRFIEMIDISILFLFLPERISRSRPKNDHIYTNMYLLDSTELIQRQCRGPLVRCILRGAGKTSPQPPNPPSAQSCHWLGQWLCEKEKSQPFLQEETALCWGAWLGEQSADGFTISLTPQLQVLCQEQSTQS